MPFDTCVGGPKVEPHIPEPQIFRFLHTYVDILLTILILGVGHKLCEIFHLRDVGDIKMRKTH